MRIAETERALRGLGRGGTRPYQYDQRIDDLVKYASVGSAQATNSKKLTGYRLWLQGLSEQSLQERWESLPDRFRTEGFNMETRFNTETRRAQRIEGVNK